MREQEGGLQCQMYRLFDGRCAGFSPDRHLGTMLNFKYNWIWFHSVNRDVWNQHEKLLSKFMVSLGISCKVIFVGLLRILVRHSVRLIRTLLALLNSSLNLCHGETTQFNLKFTECKSWDAVLHLTIWWFTTSHVGKLLIFIFSLGSNYMFIWCTCAPISKLDCLSYKKQGHIPMTHFHK